MGNVKKNDILHPSVTAVCVYIGKLRPNYGNGSVDHLARVRAFRYAHLSPVTHSSLIRPSVHSSIPLLLLGFRLRARDEFLAFRAPPGSTSRLYGQVGPAQPG